MKHALNVVVGSALWFAGYGTPWRPRHPPRGVVRLIAGTLGRYLVCLGVLALLWFFLAVAESIVEGS